jgi:hypothetical protein
MAMSWCFAYDDGVGNRAWSGHTSDVTEEE